MISPPAGPDPFAPPAIETTTGPRAMIFPRGGAYRDQRRLAKALMLLLGLDAALLGLGGALSLAVSASLVDADAMARLLELLGPGARLPGIVSLAIFGAFSIFLVRANLNARSFKGEFLEFSPASMVWWFFVPFLNLWMPYKAMRQVWTASDPEPGSGTRDAQLVGWWWVAFLVYVVAHIALVTTVAWIVGLDGDAKQVALDVALAVRGLFVANLDVVALFLVRGLAARQHRRAVHDQLGVRLGVPAAD